MRHFPLWREQWWAPSTDQRGNYYARSYWSMTTAREVVFCLRAACASAATWSSDSFVQNFSSNHWTHLLPSRRFRSSLLDRKNEWDSPEPDFWEQHRPQGKCWLSSTLTANAPRVGWSLFCPESLRTGEANGLLSNSVPAAIFLKEGSRMSHNRRDQRPNVCIQQRNRVVPRRLQLEPAVSLVRRSAGWN